MNSYRKCSILLSVVATLISLYTVLVTHSKQNDVEYKAVCDISERWSCSDVFVSKFGTGFGFMDKFVDKKSVLNQPNGIYGLLLYSSIIISCLFESQLFAQLHLLLTTIGFGFSTYGFIYAFILSPHICAVCLTGHSINYILFALGILNYKANAKTRTKRSKNKSKKSN